MKHHIVNSSNNFICGYYTDQYNFCDDVIKYFNSDNCFKKEGSSYGNNLHLQPNRVKISLDGCLEDPSLLDRFHSILKPCVDEYIKQYPYCNNYSPWGINENINIQYYKPNGGFLSWHTERGSNISPFCYRHLVFLMYLNDVEDEGGTEFFHQKLKIKPEKGLVLLWGADWTFTHRGVASPTEEKYIITGWLSFM